MRRKPEQLVTCSSCERRITIRSFCPHCGTPTSFATEQERVDYELNRWRRTHDSIAPLKAAAPAAASNGNAAPPAAASNGNGGPPSPSLRRKKAAQAQLLPGADPIAISNGNGDQRIEVLYRPDAPPARKQRAARPPRVRRQRAPKEPRTRFTGAERESESTATSSLELIGDETLRFAEIGRSGMRKARIEVTWYRVALISGGHVRWIPLEEVQQVRLSDKATVEIDAGTEQLRFIPENGITPQGLQQMIAMEVASARVANSQRHHPDILQSWCEHSSERYNSARSLFRVR
jgi:hypothetical protein